MVLAAEAVTAATKFKLFIVACLVAAAIEGDRGQYPTAIFLCVVAAVCFAMIIGMRLGSKATLELLQSKGLLKDPP